MRYSKPGALYALCGGVIFSLPTYSYAEIQPSPNLPHSYAQPDHAQVRHLDIDLTVDFAQQKLSGEVVLVVDRKSQASRNTSAPSTLVLDTRDLQIEKVSIRVNGRWWEADAKLSHPDPALGQALTIILPSEASTPSYLVKVEYETSPKATGLQWLKPEQTAGKKHPFLFSQAQAIHARSFLPLQDTPQVRVTYNAKIHTPKEVRAVMSAANSPDAPKNGLYTFTMPQPIPSYLIALAVGDLHFKAMSERTGVWAEPAYLEAAANEFSDTEKMLEVTEKAFGPYSWGRYDVLILPPSFPFGGMENPRVSFITPTVIAGDKSLVSLIAHELAHSWSGNTVTNATWNDLWLNEGFTTYLTYRIMELVYGQRRYAMERVLGYQSLVRDRKEIKSKGKTELSLVVDLKAQDPDEAFSLIPYEQGALFLFDLEQKIGRSAWDDFLREYFRKFAFQSLSSQEFLEYLKDTLGQRYPDKIDFKRVETWLYQQELPEDLPLVTSDAFDNIDKIRSQWESGVTKTEDIQTSNWTVHEWLYFLNNLPEKLSSAQLTDLDKTFSLTTSTNNEIVHSWMLIAIRNKYSPVAERLSNYLKSIGRRKLVCPLYEELVKYPEGASFAKAVYKEARPGYHYLTQHTVDAIFTDESP